MIMYINLIKLCQSRGAGRRNASILQVKKGEKTKVVITLSSKPSHPASTKLQHTSINLLKTSVL